MIYLILFLSGFFLSVLLTLFVKKIAVKFQILDRREKAPDRKFQKKPLPLLGGLGIFSAFFLVLFLSLKFKFLILPFEFKHLLGLFFASLVLMIGGFFDDKYNLKPWQTIIPPLIACLVVILSGIGIKVINNPIGGGLLYLNQLETIFFTFFWLLILMYATKLLDGLDGLVAGLTGISSLLIALFCLFSLFAQPEMAKISLILTGAVSGFLIFNFYPAKIYLGEGGSLFCGFILGVLAIISGSKVAITFLIVGLAVLDLFVTFFRRVLKGQSPFKADLGHLHHQLLKQGFSGRQTVIFYWVLSLIFGLSALFLRTRGKIILIVLLMIFVIFLIVFLEKKRPA